MASEDTPEATENINKAIIAAGSYEKGNYNCLFVTQRITYLFADHFIGGFQQKSSDFMPKWIWFVSGEYLEYTNWENGECNLNDCLIKRGAPSSGEYSGVWISSACSNQHRFVCETEL